MARKYELKQRAESLAATRERIVEATVELHDALGPARTTISAIAERAGVQRLTVYRHFPDERSLFEACSGHWAAHNPAPDPSTWTAFDDPEERLGIALAEIYAFYRSTEGMTGNLLRDNCLWAGESSPGYGSNGGVETPSRNFTANANVVADPHYSDPAGCRPSLGLCATGGGAAE